MKLLAAVEVEVLAQALDGLGDAFVVVQIDLFVFDAAPQSLDEDVVQCATSRPSRLMAIFRFLRIPVKALLVN